MTLHHPTPKLEKRIRNMALRWQYSADELAFALADASKDPDSWARWLAWDELQNGTGTNFVRPPHDRGFRPIQDNPVIRIANTLAEEAQSIAARNLFAEHARHEFVETPAKTIVLQLRVGLHRFERAHQVPSGNTALQPTVPNPWQALRRENARKVAASKTIGPQRGAPPLPIHHHQHDGKAPIQTHRWHFINDNRSPAVDDSSDPWVAAHASLRP